MLIYVFIKSTIELKYRYQNLSLHKGQKTKRLHERKKMFQNNQQ